MSEPPHQVSSCEEKIKSLHMKEDESINDKLIIRSTTFLISFSGWIDKNELRLQYAELAEEFKTELLECYIAHEYKHNFIQSCHADGKHTHIYLKYKKAIIIKAVKKAQHLFCYGSIKYNLCSGIHNYIVKVGKSKPESEAVLESMCMCDPVCREEIFIGRPIIRIKMIDVIFPSYEEPEQDEDNLNNEIENTNENSKTDTLSSIKNDSTIVSSCNSCGYNMTLICPKCFVFISSDLLSQRNESSLNFITRSNSTNTTTTTTTNVSGYIEETTDKSRNGSKDKDKSTIVPSINGVVIRMLEPEGPLGEFVTKWWYSDKLCRGKAPCYLFGCDDNFGGRSLAHYIDESYGEQSSDEQGNYDSHVIYLCNGLVIINHIKDSMKIARQSGWTTDTLVLDVTKHSIQGKASGTIYTMLRDLKTGYMLKINDKLETVTCTRVIIISKEPPIHIANNEGFRNMYGDSIDEEWVVMEVTARENIGFRTITQYRE